MDVEFEEGKSPSLYEALLIKEKNLILEVEQILGEDKVRAVSYTHLDVYKRQDLCLRQESTSFFQDRLEYPD